MSNDALRERTLFWLFRLVDYRRYSDADRFRFLKDLLADLNGVSPVFSDQDFDKYVSSQKDIHRMVVAVARWWKTESGDAPEPPWIIALRDAKRRRHGIHFWSRASRISEAWGCEQSFFQCAERMLCQRWATLVDLLEWESSGKEYNEASREQSVRQIFGACLGDLAPAALWVNPPPSKTRKEPLPTSKQSERAMLLLLTQSAASVPAPWSLPDS